MNVQNQEVGVGAFVNSSSILPPGWSVRYSHSKGRYYCYHEQKDYAQWTIPTAMEAADPALAKKRRDDAERERTKFKERAASILDDIAAKRARSEHLGSTSNKKQKKDSSTSGTGAFLVILSLYMRA